MADSAGGQSRSLACRRISRRFRRGNARGALQKLNILYIGAPLPQQAAFARWMLRRGMNEQVLVVASASEAAQDEAIFGVRAGALAALGRWEELYRLGNTPSKAPGAVLHATGDPNALVVVRGLDPDLLAPAEYALIAPLRPGQ